MPTVAPAAAKAKAISRPMPTPAPVTKAARPPRDKELALLDWGSIIVSLGMLAMPVPGGFDDGPQVGVARPPAQLALNLCGRGHQSRRVAGPARSFLHGDGIARYLL